MHHFHVSDASIEHVAPSLMFTNMIFWGGMLMLVLYNRQFYGNFFCYRGKYLLSQSIQVIVVTFVITLMLFITIQHPINTLSSIYVFFALVGALVISRAVVFFIMHHTRYTAIYTSSVRSVSSVSNFISDSLVIGAINPLKSPYTMQVSIILSVERDISYFYNKYLVHRLLIDEALVDKLTPDTLINLLDRSFEVEVVDMKSGHTRALTANELLGIDNNIVSSRYPTPSSPCLIWVNQSVNPSLVNALNTYFDAHWYFVEPGENTYDGLSLLSGLNDVEMPAFKHVVTVNSVTDELTELDQINKKLKRILSEFKVLPFIADAQYSVINHYPARANLGVGQSYANRLVNWLDLGCYAYLSEHLQVRPVSLRVGFFQSQLTDIVDKVNAQILKHDGLYLSHPLNELPYVSDQQLCDALHQITTQSARLGAGKVYVDNSSSVATTKLIENVVLAAGKYPRIHDGKHQLANELMIRFDESKAIEPVRGNVYWADNVSGTYFSELLAYDARYLSRKQFSHLTQQLYKLVDDNDVDGVIRLLDQQGEFTADETSDKVVNVSFRDVFG
jgi:hypothetical protein